MPFPVVDPWAFPLVGGLLLLAVRNIGGFIPVLPPTQGMMTSDESVAPDAMRVPSCGWTWAPGKDPAFPHVRSVTNLLESHIERPRSLNNSFFWTARRALEHTWCSFLVLVLGTQMMVEQRLDEL